MALANAAFAQVFDPGPSDPASFDTVINLSTTFTIGGSSSVSGNTQVNVGNDGSIGSSFDANFGSEVNITGGTVGGASMPTLVAR